jgi:phosphoenolpyruvate---glycerone phosphotransferase subunit DhaM
MTVGMVIVSHSATLARGVVELAGQMAPDVTLVPIGGAADGGLGTDFDAVSTGISQADSGSGVVLLYDLGSAKMVADMAAETADAARVVDAPLVTGAVAAAVAAQGGADLDAVVAAALRGEAAEEPGPEAARGEDLLLTNEIGLHARPAALLAKALTGLDAVVTISFSDKQVDGRSVLGLMALGARGGDTIRLAAIGSDAPEALTRIRELAARNFDE